MNFGEVIKNEILSKNIKDYHCQKAFLAGILRGTGIIFTKDDRIGLIFRVNGEQTAMVVSNYFSSAFSYELREVSVSPNNFSKKETYEFTLFGDRVDDILSELGIITLNQDGWEVCYDLFAKFKHKDCCMHAFMRGLFVTSGRCSVPTETSKNTGYHLELIFSSAEVATQVNTYLNSLSIYAKDAKKKGGYILYIKSADEIKDFIAFLPAPVSVLKISDVMISREMINNINRKKNCDIGNVSKQVEASLTQINAINKIIELKGANYLKEDLRIVAEYRVKYQEDTLTELADKLGITKSCLNHRLRKIMEIYKSI